MRKKLSKVAVALSFLGVIVLQPVDGMNMKSVPADAEKSGNKVMPLSNSMASGDDEQLSDCGSDSESDNDNESDSESDSAAPWLETPMMKPLDNIYIYAKYLHGKREPKYRIRTDWTDTFEDASWKISDALTDIYNGLRNKNEALETFIPGDCPISDIIDVTQYLNTTAHDCPEVFSPDVIKSLHNVDTGLWCIKTRMWWQTKLWKGKTCIPIIAEGFDISNGLGGIDKNVVLKLCAMTLFFNLKIVRPILGMSAENYFHFKNPAPQIEKEKEKDGH